MIAEANDLIGKSRECLKKAADIIKLGYADEAGRLAYLAGLHAAQAYIFHQTGKLAKTHKGAHNQFFLLVNDDNRFDEALRCFLPQAYEIKAIADYEYGPSAMLPPEAAQSAIATAERFVNLIASLVV